MKRKKRIPRKTKKRIRDKYCNPNYVIHGYIIREEDQYHMNWRQWFREDIKGWYDIYLNK